MQRRSSVWIGLLLTARLSSFLGACVSEGATASFVPPHISQAKAPSSCSGVASDVEAIAVSLGMLGRAPNKLVVEADAAKYPRSGLVIGAMAAIACLLTMPILLLAVSRPTKGARSASAKRQAKARLADNSPAGWLAWLAVQSGSAGPSVAQILDKVHDVRSLTARVAQLDADLAAARKQVQSQAARIKALTDQNKALADEVAGYEAVKRDVASEMSVDTSPRQDQVSSPRVHITDSPASGTSTAPPSPASSPSPSRYMASWCSSVTPSMISSPPSSHASSFSLSSSPTRSASTTGTSTPTGLLSLSRPASTTGAQTTSTACCTSTHWDPAQSDAATQTAPAPATATHSTSSQTDSPTSVTTQTDPVPTAPTTTTSTQTATPALCSAATQTAPGPLVPSLRSFSTQTSASKSVATHTTSPATSARAGRTSTPVSAAAPSTRPSHVAAAPQDASLPFQPPNWHVLASGYQHRYVPEGMSRTRWCHEDYQEKELIWQGNGGCTVHIAECLRSGATVVLKKYDLEHTPEDQILAEITTHSLCHHKNIVQFYGAFHDDVCVWIVMEYVTGGSLAAYMEEQGWASLSECMASKVAGQVLSAFDHIHSLGMIHRDLKPANILVVPAPGSPDQFDIKVCDFGYACFAASQPRGIMGTPGFFPPEVLEGPDCGPYGQTADLYLVGATLFQLLTCMTLTFPRGLEPAVDENDRLAHDIAERRHIHDVWLAMEYNLTTPTRKFILSMVQQDPTQRPTVQELLQDPFFSVELS